MVGRGAVLRALAASLAALGAVVLSAPSAFAQPFAQPSAQPFAATGAGPGRVTDPAPETAPLAVTIDRMTPSALPALPASGSVVVQGTVTNDSDETWTTINLYTFIGDDDHIAPIRGPKALAAAVKVDAGADVGGRITDAGTPGKVDELEPGQSAPYTVTVPVKAFQLTQPGVYWFGVHASGQSATSPRDDFADGKARTFLPYLPARFAADPLPTAFVLPLHRRIVYTADGSLGRTARWLTDLSPGGRLSTLVALADSAGVPLTLLVDPALLDAVARLAHGNPPRSLGPATPDGTATDSPGQDPSQEPDTEDDADEGLSGIDPDRLSAEAAPLARAAAGWLGRFRSAVSDAQILTLPYGDIDLPAALDVDALTGKDDGRALYELAVAQRSAVLKDLGVESSPAISAPGGYLDAPSIAAAPDGTLALLSDRAFRGATRTVPTVARIGGHTVVTTSSGFEQGGPGPSSATAGVALRQRLLSEVAVRLITHRDDPLVVRLPDNWTEQDADSFLDGLDVPWMRALTVGGVVGSTAAHTVVSDDVLYPDTERAAQTDAESFEEVDRLIARGDSLQSLLTDNNAIGSTITEQALSVVSFDLRGVQVAARRSARASERWVRQQLDAVEIVAPRGVTLSSDRGSFAATLANRLDQAVTVSVVARSDGGLRVQQPDPVTLAPHSRTTVLLKARATSSRVHNVVLLVTDADGHPIGPRDELPIRSAQVSDVIWIIMGTGTGLLFVAVVVRLVRRVRAARRRSADDVAGARA